VSERHGKAEIQAGISVHRFHQLTEDVLLGSRFTYCQQAMPHKVAAPGSPALLN